MKVGDLVRRKSWNLSEDIAIVVGFKEVFEGCGNRFPIVHWLDTHEIDSCSHRRLEVINVNEKD